jgi:gas vesicle protein
MARDDNGAGTVIVSFVLGAITGAAVALLMAPATGEETRRVLGEKAREGRQRAEEAARQGRDFVERSKSTVISAVERGREAYEQARGGHQGPGHAGPGGQPGGRETL